MRRILAASLIVLGACSNATVTPAAKVPDSLLLESPAFTGGMRIPDAYACEPTGQNISVPLRWQQVPEGTAEFVLVMDDPNADGFAHWVLYGIPPEVDRIKLGETPAEAIRGKNDTGTLGYAGPCPPPREVHRYVFTLYALRSPLHFAEGATKADITSSLDGRAIAKGTLFGTYSRQ